MAQVPDARIYEDERQQANNAFDGRLTRRINAASINSEWDDVLGILVRAHQNNNLRTDVVEQFLARCPHKWMRNHLLACADPSALEPVAVEYLNAPPDDPTIESEHACKPMTEEELIAGLVGLGDCGDATNESAENHPMAQTVSDPEEEISDGTLDVEGVFAALQRLGEYE